MTTEVTESTDTKENEDTEELKFVIPSKDDKLQSDLVSLGYFYDEKGALININTNKRFGLPINEKQDHEVRSKLNVKVQTFVQNLLILNYNFNKILIKTATIFTSNDYFNKNTILFLIIGSGITV